MSAHEVEKTIASAKSPKGKVRVLKALVNKTDDDEVRQLARHMLKYAEQEVEDEKFMSFLQKKARTLDVKVSVLTRNQIVQAREEFDNL